MYRNRSGNFDKRNIGTTSVSLAFREKTLKNQSVPNAAQERFAFTESE